MCLAMGVCQLYEPCFRAACENKQGVGLLECGKIRKFFGNKKVSYKVFLQGLADMMRKDGSGTRREGVMLTSEERREYARNYYWTHREEIRARRSNPKAENYEEQRQRRLEYNRKWREEHREYFRKWQAERRQRIQEYNRKYYEEHKKRDEG